MIPAIDLNKQSPRSKQTAQPRPALGELKPLAKVVRGPWTEEQQAKNFFASLNNYNVFWNRVRQHIIDKADARQTDWLTPNNAQEYADFIDPRVRLTAPQKRAWLRTKSDGHVLDMAYAKFLKQKNKTEKTWAAVVNWVRHCDLVPVFTNKAGELIFTKRTRTITATIDAANDTATYTAKFGTSYYSKYTDGIFGGGGGGGGGAFDYIGVPQPTNPMPGLSGQPSTIAIMPTLPNGAHYTAHDWFSGNANAYHPCEETTPIPTPGGAADEYVVAYSSNTPAGNDGTAGNGGRGTVSAPRASLPTGTIPAGNKLFLVGAGTAIPATYGVSQEGGFTQWQTQDFSNITFAGTAANICWVVGIDLPRIRTRNLNTPNSAHTIFDGVVITAGEDQSYRGSWVPNGNNYMTFRNGAFLGVYRDQGHSSISINNCLFFMSYNNIFRFCGRWDGVGTSIKDWHAFRPQYGNRFIWCIDCEFSYLSGDATQFGNSNYTGAQSNVSHFMWYAGNEAHHVREQQYDPKSSYHCFCVENYSHDMINGGVGANQVHIIASQDNEGSSGGSDNFFISHHWIIANVCDGAGPEAQSGIQNKNNANNGTGSANGGLVRLTAMIGNVVKNMASGGGLAIRSSAGSNTPSVVWNCFNTVYNVSGTAYFTTMWQPENGGNSAGCVHNHVGNVALECGAHFDFPGGSDTSMTTNASYNWYYNAAGGEVVASGFNGVDSNNTTGTDPVLTDPANNDFTPDTGSPLIDAVPEPACFQLFENLYGLSIRRDYLGNARPALGGNWTAGAVEV